MEPDQPRLVETPISIQEVAKLAERQFGDMVKAAVDVGRGIMAIGGELHSDEEALLLENGSAQSDIWGINLYPAEVTDAWIEFDSMINVRPSQGNRSRAVDDPSIQARIRLVVRDLIQR